MVLNMINFVMGDVTNPVREGNKIIAHCCNDIGVMGAGVALAIRNKWPEVFAEYALWHEAHRHWCREGLPLGSVQFVPVSEEITIANVIGQTGVGFSNGPPVRYEALAKGMDRTFAEAIKLDASVHVPRLASGLAGGRWGLVEKHCRLMEWSKKVPLFVYDFEAKGIEMP